MRFRLAFPNTKLPVQQTGDLNTREIVFDNTNYTDVVIGGSPIINTADCVSQFGSNI
jgi:hypothetical protein